MLAYVTVIVFTAWTVQAIGIQVNTTETVTSGRPRDCRDLIQHGRIYEGNYLVYPEISASSNPKIIYCSQNDGMEALPNKTIGQESARNCLDLLNDGIVISGPYTIYPNLNRPADPVLVFCDQDTDGGGWTVIQMRHDGVEDFYRSWDEYAEGFGDVKADHYVGNDNIVHLTDQGINELRVKLEDWDSNTAYAHYQLFHLESFVKDYQLEALFYDGTAGDSLAEHNGLFFSTYDEDHDDSPFSCAERNHGGWWYENCGPSNLNGLYYPSANTDGDGDGMRWYTFAGWDSLKYSKMMLRPSSSSTISALAQELLDTHEAGIP
ncbi:unnamed protein product [Meganyctiphanes norvegica]|uniref:Fibrinogen C-terminal domain-containing protein n=1 Tax=Meganyctiphanes norvegica TaxID=48144 RepID=A0AAV2PL27_MEGNR